MSGWIFGSLRGRLILSAVVGGLAGLAVIGVLLYLVFVDSVEAGFDDRLEVAIESLLASAEVDETGALDVTYIGEEPRFALTYRGWYWQVAPADALPTDVGPAVRRSHSLGDWDLTVPGKPEKDKRRAGVVYGPMSQKLRYVSNDYLLTDGDRLFRFTVAGDYGEVEQRIDRFRWALAASLLIMAGALAIVLAFQLRFASAPMNRIRHAIAEVRSGAEPRLKGRFLKEVEPLVSELNALLDHNAEVVARARTQVGNLAHALKTPLAVLQNEADTDCDTLAETVRRETESMRRQVDHYLARARAAASVNVLGSRADVSARIAAFVRTMEKIYAERGLAFDTACPEDLCFRGSPQDLDEMLGNLIDNAAKWARGRVRVHCSPAPEAGTFRVTVEDDGPGLTEAQRALATARGERLDEQVPGSGLGLSIVSDIAEMYAGRLDLDRSAMGGLRAELTLPAA